MQGLTSEWVSNPDNPARQFRVRGLSGIEFLEWNSHMNANSRDGGRIVITAEQLRLALRAVSGWRGVTGGDGAELPFSQASLEAALDWKEADWLVRQVLDRTRLGEESEKN